MGKNISKCPYMSGGGYETLDQLTDLADSLGIKEAIRHVSHEDCKYPGRDTSSRFTSLLRAEITKTFGSSDEFIDTHFEEFSLEDCLEKYKEWIDIYDLDLGRCIIPQNKTYDALLEKLDKEWADDDLVTLLLTQTKNLQVKKGYTLKEATMKVMQHWQTMISFDRQGESLMGGILGSIRDKTREGLLLFADLQDKPYSRAQVREWNNRIESDARYIDAIQLLHYVLIEYVKRFCKDHPERFDHTFYPLQEICRYEEGELVPHDRFLKIIAANIGPLLYTCVDEGDPLSLGEKMKEKRLFEQFIFGFNRDEEGVKITAIEPKSCPAKKVIKQVAQKVLPLLFIEK